VSLWNRAFTPVLQPLAGVYVKCGLLKCAMRYIYNARDDVTYVVYLLVSTVSVRERDGENACVCMIYIYDMSSPPWQSEARV
jgi:hypothetical protein